MSLLLLLLLASSAAHSENTLTFLSGAKPWPRECISMLRTPERCTQKLSGRLTLMIN